MPFRAPAHCLSSEAGPSEFFRRDDNMSASTLSWSSRVLNLVKRMNNFFAEGSSRSSCKKFLIGENQFGFIPPAVLAELANYADVFQFTKNKDGSIESVTFSDSLETFNERSANIEEVMQDLRAKDAFVSLKGWRNEKYQVSNRFLNKPQFMIERSASCLLGTIKYGVHLNGYFKDECGRLNMWIGRRSPTKQTFPAKLDQIVAGGIICGHSVLGTLIKECQEEASISEDLASQAKPVGLLSYCYEDERGIFPEVEFVYDLELPQDFKPVASDGEVSDFYSWPIEEVKEKIATDQFKPNCALVVLDFLIRHGYITPDSEPYYMEFVLGMHQPLY